MHPVDLILTAPGLLGLMVFAARKAVTVVGVLAFSAARALVLLWGAA